MFNLKDKFPIFATHPDLVYLDSAASAQKPGVVIETMEKVMRERYANVHRGLYPLSENVTELYEGAREKVRGFIHARSTKEIIFTKNATEAINLVAYAWALDNLEQGDVIVVTEMEHHSNLLPWSMVADRVGAEVVSIPLDHENHKLQIINYKEIIEKYQKRIKLIAVTHVSNVLGTINPIKEIVALARSVNARILVDGCQAVAHLPVDVLDLDVDFYAFSGHKLYGPTGVGVLYAKRDHLEYMKPFLRGGEMVLEVAEKPIWKELPWKFEAGTPPIVEAIGLGAAVDFVAQIGFDKILAHERALIDLILKELSDLPNCRMLGCLADGRIGTFSFVLEGAHPHDVAHRLGEQEICVRAGHHCAQPLHRLLSIPASLRLSLGLYNSTEDILKLKPALNEAIGLFRV